MQTALATRCTAACRPASRPGRPARATSPADTGNLATGQACAAARLHQRHDPGACRGSSSSAACATTSTMRRSATRSTRPTRRQHADAVLAAEHHYFSSRAGVIVRADKVAVLLFLLQHLVQSVARAARLDDRHDEPLPPETEQGVRGRRQVRVLQRQPVAERRAVPDHQVQRALAERRRHVQRRPARCGSRASAPASPAASRRTGRCSAATPISTRRIINGIGAGHHGQRAAQHAAELGHALDDLHVQRRTWEIGGGATYIGHALRQQHQHRHRCRTSPGST